MSNPLDAGTNTISVTMKYGKDDPWVVFHGPLGLVYADICTAYGYEPVDGMTLHELVQECDKIVRGGQAVSNILGGRVVKTESTKPEPTDPDAGIFKEIEAAQTNEQLIDVWSRNKDRFKANPKLADASKARKAQITNNN